MHINKYECIDSNTSECIEENECLHMNKEDKKNEVWDEKKKTINGFNELLKTIHSCSFF